MNAEAQNPLDAIAWNELITPDPDEAMKFYSELFGWTTERFPMPGTEYTLFKKGGQVLGGVMATPQPDMPPHWMNYVSVSDLEESVARATALGAILCAGPMSIGDAGRLAIIQDPQGAAIGLHEMPES